MRLDCLRSSITGLMGRCCVFFRGAWGSVRRGGGSSQRPLKQKKIAAILNTCNLIIIKGLRNRLETMDNYPVLLNKDDSRSILNMVPPAISDRISDAIASHGALFEKDEHDLYKFLRSVNLTPNATDNRLRLKFWMEYDYAHSNNKKSIDIQRVISGICLSQYFYNHYLMHPTRVAWLLCVPTGYSIKTNEALEYGIEQLRDILGEDHIDKKTGKVLTDLANTKLRIVALLDNRVHGSVIQKSMNLQVNSNSPDIAKAIITQSGKNDIEELNNRLEHLREHERKLLNGGITVKEESIQTVSRPAEEAREGVSSEASNPEDSRDN